MRLDVCNRCPGSSVFGRPPSIVCRGLRSAHPAPPRYWNKGCRPVDVHHTSRGWTPLWADRRFRVRGQPRTLSRHPRYQNIDSNCFPTFRLRETGFPVACARCEFSPSKCSHPGLRRIPAPLKSAAMHRPSSMANERHFFALIRDQFPAGNCPAASNSSATELMQ